MCNFAVPFEVLHLEVDRFMTKPCSGMTLTKTSGRKRKHIT